MMMRVYGQPFLRTIHIALLTVAIAPSALAQQPGAQQPNDQQPPWLVFNVAGHTADVKGLAFTLDSKRLCSAGLDKLVEVWNTGTAARDLRRTMLVERSIRWQVGRSLRGSIYALASATSDNLLAIGGYGATGALGEILLVDPVQGTLLHTLKGHRQTVCSLAFSADGQWLASLDVAGQVMLWQRGQWNGVTLYEPDAQVYGAATATLIEQQPNLRPLTIVGNTHVIVPVCLGPGADRQLIWKLQQIGLANRKDIRTFDAPHRGMVSAVAVSRDGRWLASGDLAGNVYLGAIGQGPQRIPAEGVALSMTFDPTARSLILGTAVTARDSKGHVQVWDVATRTKKRERVVPENVNAVAVSPDGNWLAYTGGEHHAVYLGRIDDPATAVPLRSTARRITKVAFASNDPIYRIAFGTTYQPGFNEHGQVEQSFDTTALELDEVRPIAGEWIDVASSQGRWRAERRPDGGLQLYRDNVAKGFVKFDSRFEGSISSYCWIGSMGGEPRAIAVGTRIQNSIYVLSLAEQGACPVLRHFRGHNDEVMSLGISRDVRYLVSGSADGTVRVWSLSLFADGRLPTGRWGAHLAVDGNELKIDAIDPAGPLYFKGVRAGDTITSLSWPDKDRAAVEKRPAEMLKQLTNLPWATQVVFEYSRGGAAQSPFQLLPAWQSLANLFVTADREWAFWTPEGYYDASANGHTLFGWQVNHGLDELPEFFRADQFRKKLERPDVLEKLLPTGNLEASLRLAALEPPSHGDEVIARQIAGTPRLNILTPRAGSTVAQNTATVRVRIRVPTSEKLARAKLFANGVVATESRLVDQRNVGDVDELTYEWNAPLPNEERNLIQVFASTNNSITGFNNLLLERTDLAPPKELPKLHILALGVDQYQDPSIQPLAWSVADARSVVDLLKTKAAGLYAVDDVNVMVNEQVTRTGWSEAISYLSAKLRKTAHADDLLVIFMAGHGFVDPKDEVYYYAGYDLTREKYEAGDFASSISWNDFAQLADIPCRKLTLLDTCHSGAIQPLRSRNLKAAVRAFQDDVIFTLTASAGNERSEENADWRHGAFTKSLLEALAGDSTTPASSGVVMLNDVVRHVQQSVPKLTDGRQNPTAAPEELLPFVSLRLTSLKQQASSRDAGAAVVEAP
ncbi:MAG TPA: caspase family protein [Pirellulales bacterium]|nr:caspase family protein [Pirellulales bacterium]